MKRVKVDVRITEADTVSDALVRIYKEAAARDGAVANDGALAAIMGEVESLSAKITTAIRADKVSRSPQRKPPLKNCSPPTTSTASQSRAKATRGNRL